MEAAHSLSVGDVWSALSSCVAPSVLSAVSRAAADGGLGFERMSPVQQATIPQFVGRKDVVVEACTGSGKTLAFLVPTLHILLQRDTPLRPHEVGAIVLLPTRELARQVEAVCSALLGGLRPRPASPLRVMLMVGGDDEELSAASYLQHGANVVVGTPGRIEAALARGLGAGRQTVRAKELEVLVLDEADRMLALGFQQSLSVILAHLPKQRRTGLFSATQTDSVDDLIRAGMRNPVRVRVAAVARDASAGGGAAEPAARLPGGLYSYYAFCEHGDRLLELLRVLTRIQAAEKPCKAIVYCLTCASVDFFAKLFSDVPVLRNSVTGVCALHGRLKQKRRFEVLRQFAEATQGVMFCTDVAARGLDIPDVSWVLQYDPPQDPDTFVHRIGRTARMGRSGAGLVFLTQEESSYIHFMTGRRLPMQELTWTAAAELGIAAATEPDLGQLQSDALLAQVKDAVRKDRDLFDKGQRAFLSFLKGYREHILNYVFRYEGLNLAGLAGSYALLALPRLKYADMGGRSVEYPAENTGDVAYRDKSREKQRQEKLRRMQAEATRKAAPRERRPQTKQTKQAPKLAQAEQSSEDDSGGETEDDDDEIAYEAGLLKKLGTKKITEAEFDEALRLRDEHRQKKSAARSKKRNPRAGASDDRKDSKRQRLGKLRRQKAGAEQRRVSSRR